MDEMVLATQKWLNATYTGKTGWVTVEENGKTGWNTIYALIRAFQIEKGSTAPTGNFGEWTETQLKNLGTIGRNDNASPDNVIKILQGAMWCKGYWTAALTGVFDSVTENGIKDLQRDAGISETGQVDFYLWKALLSMDQFVMLNGGNAGIRTFQQYFNSNYSDYFEKYVPCDGLAGRDLYTCFIYLLQKDEGFGPANAYGNFGNTTYSLCPNISSSNASSYSDTIMCIKIALFLEGYGVDLNLSDVSGTFNQNLLNAVHNYNVFMEQEQYNFSTYIPKETIKQLYTSNGYTGRIAKACDTATPINTNARAQVLVQNGYDTVGRYLTYGLINGENKQLTKEELSVLKANGISVFPIYQTSGNYLEYFNYDQGYTDAMYAYLNARELGIKENTVIYFAVDVDVLEGYIPYYIVSYFEGVFDYMSNKGRYKVGVYGTRNVCEYVLANGYAQHSFISNMSTGYSGNMGFAMPRNWSFNQFATTTISFNGTSIEIDKVDTSRRDNGFTQLSDPERTAAAVRCFMEEAIDGLGMGSILFTREIPLATEVPLVSSGPVLITAKADANVNWMPNTGQKVIVTKDSDNNLTLELNSTINNISSSFTFTNEEKELIETTLTKLCHTLPNGSEIHLGIGVEDGRLVFTFIVHKDNYLFDNNSFDVSVIFKFKITSEINGNSGYSYGLSLTYSFEEVWAMFATTIGNIQHTLEKYIDSNLVTVFTIVIVIAVVLFALFNGVFHILILAAA